MAQILRTVEIKIIFTGCITMIGAVLKLIIFTSMVNRITNTSRYERVTQQVSDIPTNVRCMYRGPCRPRTVPRFNPLWLLPLGLREGQSVCATCVINVLSYSFISTSIYNSVHHTCEYNQLQNRSNHFDTPCILRGFKTPGGAFRLPYSIAFDCSIRPFSDLFHPWLYTSHLSRFFGKGLVFSFLRNSKVAIYLLINTII